MRLISKAFQSLLRSLCWCSTAQEQLILVASALLFTCVTSVCSHSSIRASRVCCTLPSHAITGTNGLSHWLSQQIQGSPRTSGGEIPASFTTSLGARLHCGFFCHQVLFCGESQISSSWTDCQGLSASVKSTFERFATNSCFWMTFCQGIFNYCHPQVYLQIDLSAVGQQIIVIVEGFPPKCFK